MTTLLGWTLGLIGAYVVISGIVYVILRYALGAGREDARDAAIGWIVSLYVAVKRLIGK